MDTELPALIPTRDAAVPLALATRAQIAKLTECAEKGALDQARAHARLKQLLPQWTAALSYFKAGVPADTSLKAALAARNDGSSTESTATKHSIQEMVRDLRRALALVGADVESLNSVALAGREALAVFKAGDPAAMTYGEARGRTLAGGALPVVNVAAPIVHMPERKSQTITATKLEDGSLRAVVGPTP